MKRAKRALWELLGRFEQVRLNERGRHVQPPRSQREQEAIDAKRIHRSRNSRNHRNRNVGRSAGPDLPARPNPAGHYMPSGTAFSGDRATVLHGHAGNRDTGSNRGRSTVLHGHAGNRATGSNRSRSTESVGFERSAPAVAEVSSIIAEQRGCPIWAPSFAEASAANAGREAGLAAAPRRRKTVPPSVPAKSAIGPSPDLSWLASR